MLHLTDSQGAELVAEAERLTATEGRKVSVTEVVRRRTFIPSLPSAA